MASLWIFVLYTNIGIVYVSRIKRNNWQSPKYPRSWGEMMQLRIDTVTWTQIIPPMLPTSPVFMFRIVTILSIIWLDTCDYKWSWEWLTTYNLLFISFNKQFLISLPRVLQYWATEQHFLYYPGQEINNFQSWYPSLSIWSVIIGPNTSNLYIFNPAFQNSKCSSLLSLCGKCILFRSRL